MFSNENRSCECQHADTSMNSKELLEISLSDNNRRTDIKNTRNRLQNRAPEY